MEKIPGRGISRHPDLRLTSSTPVAKDATHHPRSRAPRAHRRSPRNASVDPRLIVLRREWEFRFREIGATLGSSPFTIKVPHLWLPAPRQLLLPALNLKRPTLRAGEDLDLNVAEHTRRAFVDDLGEDVRIVFGLAGGRFFGLRGGSAAFHASLGLYHCRSCAQWWFLVEWGGWQCRCCGAYEGNALIADQFTDTIELSRWRRSAV